MQEKLNLEFHVHRNIDGHILFNYFDPSVGGGVSPYGFEAPHRGIYRFSFSASTASAASWLYYFIYNVKTRVEVIRNDKTVFYISDYSSWYSDSVSNNLSHTWIWELRQGEKISFYIDGYLESGIHYPITFTGERIYY